MIQRLIIAVAVIATIGCSCSNKPSIELKGAYVIGGFQMQTDINLDTLKQNGMLNFGETPFNFIGKDSVILDKEFGETYFGASAFKYQLTDNKMIFINGDKTIKMDYVYDGFFRLKIDNPNFRRFDLVEAKE